VSDKQLAQFEETHRGIDETIRKLGKAGVAETHVREIADSWSHGLQLASETLEVAMRTNSSICLCDLQFDMVLNQEIWTKDALLLALKARVSMPRFTRLKAFGKSRGIVEPFSVTHLSGATFIRRCFTQTKVQDWYCGPRTCAESEA
jgi:hypothetical protein